MRTSRWRLLVAVAVAGCKPGSPPLTVLPLPATPLASRYAGELPTVAGDGVPRPGTAILLAVITSCSAKPLDAAVEVPRGRGRSGATVRGPLVAIGPLPEGPYELRIRAIDYETRMVQWEARSGTIDTLQVTLRHRAAGDCETVDSGGRMAAFGACPAPDCQPTQRL